MFGSILHLKCPDCGKQIKPVEVYNVATTVRYRTCRCRARWVVVVKPITQDDTKRIDRVEWNRRQG